MDSIIATCVAVGGLCGMTVGTAATMLVACVAQWAKPTNSKEWTVANLAAHFMPTGFIMGAICGGVLSPLFVN